MNDVTRILAAIEHGDPQAAEQLMPLVYDELRRLAALRLVPEAPGHTLQATALVHEAYLRLVGPSGGGAPWNSRGHFFAAAAQAMRRILVESARRKAATKRGGVERRRLPLEEFHRVDESPEDLIDLDEALTRLAAEDPGKAELVQLRFFGGLTMPEAAEALGISLATAERWWSYVRAWLYCELEGTPEDPERP